MYALDLSIFNALFGLAGQHRWSDWLIVFFAEYLPYLVVLAVMYAGYKSWCEGKKQMALGYFVAFVSAGIARLVTSLIRFFYHHPRPPAVLHITSLFSETSYSFPSGHAIFFFALATGVYLVNKKFGKLLLILSIVIGLARIAAGVHWPSDILAGAILGVVIAIGIFRIWQFFYKENAAK